MSARSIAARSVDLSDIGEPMPRRVRDLPTEMLGFKARLREAMTEQRLVTRSFGTAQSSIVRLLNDDEYDPGLSLVYEVARVTGLRLGWLLSGEPPKVGSVRYVMVTSEAQLDTWADAIKAGDKPQPRLLGSGRSGGPGGSAGASSKPKPPKR